MPDRVTIEDDYGTRQWSNCGERGGTAFPFRFWRGNTVPLAYTMTATYNTSNTKMCVKCMI